MKKQFLCILLSMTMVGAIMSISIVSSSSPSLAFMVKRNGAVIHHFKPLKRKIPKKARFLGWDGNKLLTTAGTFVITNSVKLVDLAGTKEDASAPYGTRTPQVHLFYKNNRLVKVVIK